MLKTRVMPCLLVSNGRLVKTVEFRNPAYVGDPVNAIKIYNEKEVDELILLDITATAEGRKPDFAFLAEIVDECFMPLAYGGGIRDIDDIGRLFSLGIEKAAINWRIDRIAFIERNILRLSVAELLDEGNGIPFKATINEAVDIAKKFGNKESSSFVNGIINKVADMIDIKQRKL
ncbi:MAG TPA: HisA/HisF-related TIM barrel protein [bacterium]|nr:HisA/HisF-related TIM barrel protein [bacterium]